MCSTTLLEWISRMVEGGGCLLFGEYHKAVFRSRYFVHLWSKSCLDNLIIKNVLIHTTCAGVAWVGTGVLDRVNWVYASIGRAVLTY